MFKRWLVLIILLVGYIYTENIGAYQPGDLVWQDNINVVGSYGDLLYVSYSDRLSCVDISTGKKIWTIKESPGYLTISEGYLFFISGGYSSNSKLFFVNALTGAIVNTYEYPGTLSVLTVSQGLIVVYDYSIVMCFEIATAKNMWVNKCNPYSVYSAGNYVYARSGYNDATLNRFDLVTGKTIWQISESESVSNIQVVNDRLYYTHYNKDLICVDNNAGVRKWVYNGSIEGKYEIGDVFVAFAGNGQANYLNAETGQVVWQTTGDWISVANKKGFVADKNMIRCYDILTGEKKWEFDAGFNIFLTQGPLINGDYVYIINERIAGVYELTCVNAVSGLKNWSFPSQRSELINPSSRLTLRGSYLAASYNSLTVCLKIAEAPAAPPVPASPEEDKMPPAVQMSYPKHLGVYNSPNIKITGASSDPSGVSVVKIKINDGDWIAASGTTTWSMDVSLNFPSNTISIYVRDNKGNELYNADSATIFYSPDVQSTEKVWKKSIGKGNIYSPVLANGSVFSGSDELLFSADAKTGTSLWEKSGKFNDYNSTLIYPFYSQDKLFMLKNEGSSMKLWCLSFLDGSELWSATPFGYASSYDYQSNPAGYNGSVVVNWGDYLESFNAITGVNNWRYNTNSWMSMSSNRTSCSPIVANGNIYVQAESRMFYCMDALTSKVKWRINTNYDYDTYPVVSGEYLYMYSNEESKQYTSSSNKFACYNAVTGSLVWSRVVKKIGTFNISDGRIYLVEGDTIYGLKAGSGDQLWKTRIDNISFSVPVVTEKYLYFGGTDLFCINASTGAPVWQFIHDKVDEATKVPYYTTENSFSTPVVSQGLVYSIYGRALYCVKAANGDMSEYPMFGYSPERNRCYNTPQIDLNPPGVQITTPLKGQYSNQPRIVVKGKATDPAGVSAVMVKVNDGYWQNTTGNVDWSLDVDLTEGKNTISVYAKDSFGNEIFNADSTHITFGINYQPWEKIWDFQTEGSITKSPLAAEGKVYVDGGGLFYCLNYSTGDIIWNWNDNKKRVSSALPVVIDNKLYLGSNCYDATTGLSIRENTKNPGFMTTLHRDKLFVVTTCFDANSGIDIWKFIPTGSSYNYYSTDYSSNFNRPSTGFGEHVFFPSDQGQVHCLDVNTGKEIWRLDTKKTYGQQYNMNGAIQSFSSPTSFASVYIMTPSSIAHGNLYVMAGKFLFCVSVETGKIKWQLQIGEYAESIEYDNDPPVLSGGFVYLKRGGLYCINAFTGAVVWKYNCVDATAPAISGGYIYFGEGDYNSIPNINKLNCFNAVSGKKIWDFNIDSQINAPPVVANGYVYFGASDFKIYCLRAAEGDPGEWPMYQQNNARTGYLEKPLVKNGNGLNLRCALENQYQSKEPYVLYTYAQVQSSFSVSASFTDDIIAGSSNIQSGQTADGYLSIYSEKDKTEWFVTTDESGNYVFSIYEKPMVFNWTVSAFDWTDIVNVKVPNDKNLVGDYEIRAWLVPAGTSRKSVTPVTCKISVTGNYY